MYCYNNALMPPFWPGLSLKSYFNLINSNKSSNWLHKGNK